MQLNRIVQKKILAPGIVLFEIENRDIAVHALAGQFVVVRKDEFAERVPLTIADFDPLKGTLVLIIQEVGVSTKKLCALEEGSAILDVLGPLGQPSEIANFGTVACIGGGVGVAPMYPITKELHRAGNRVNSIIGARSRELIILKDEMKAVSDVLHVCTDDGSEGFKGFVSGKLSELIGSG